MQAILPLLVANTNEFVLTDIVMVILLKQLGGLST